MDAEVAEILDEIEQAIAVITGETVSRQPGDVPAEEAPSVRWNMLIDRITLTVSASGSGDSFTTGGALDYGEDEGRRPRDDLEDLEMYLRAVWRTYNWNDIEYVIWPGKVYQSLFDPGYPFFPVFRVTFLAPMGGLEKLIKSYEQD